MFSNKVHVKTSQGSHWLVYVTSTLSLSMKKQLGWIVYILITLAVQPCV